MKKIFVLVLPVLLISVFSCSNRNQKEDTDQNTKAIETKTDSMTKKALAVRSAYLQELKTMNNEQLARQMEKESDRGLEPFNSLAYKEALKRGPSFAENLVQMIKDSTKISLLNLLALNKIEINYYNKVKPSTRTAILLDALKNSKLYNAFGLPHIRIEFAGKVIIQEGKPFFQSICH